MVSVANEVEMIYFDVVVVNESCYQLILMGVYVVLMGSQHVLVDVRPAVFCAVLVIHCNPANTRNIKKNR
jgi:hypothetical protein